MEMEVTAPSGTRELCHTCGNYHTYDKPKDLTEKQYQSDLCNLCVKVARPGKCPLSLWKYAAIKMTQIRDMLLDNLLDRGWFKNNPEGFRRFVEQVKDAAIKDREKAIARAEKWRKDNPEKYAEQVATQQAARLKQGNSYQAGHYGPQGSGNRA